MQLSHVFPVRSMVFDEPNLVSHAGLVPAMSLAARAGLVELADRHLSVSGGPGHAAGLKVSALVAGMVAGADSIADMALLRHGGMHKLFAGVRAPTTLGTFLRSLKFGHVRQLDAVAARFLTGLNKQVALVDAAAAITFVDVDDTVRRTYGYAKQGSGYGYSGVKGLNALLGTVSSAGRAPVIVATRLRKGSANSARGAARLVADSLKTTRACGVSGTVILRADSAYYGADAAAAARRGGAHFSITARKDRAVTAAISAIPGDSWVKIRYPRAIFDEELAQWVSDAEVAETSFTAFASRGKAGQVAARLIVRRVHGRQPRPRDRRRAGRAVPGLATPRGVHRLAAADAHRGSRSPPPRDHRTGHRRSEERADGPPALGPVHGQLRMAGPGRDRLQLDPSGRCRRRRPAPQGRYRDHPHSADQHRRQDCPLRPPRHSATTDQLAVAQRVSETDHRQHRTADNQLTSRPTPRKARRTAGETGPAGRPAMPPNRKLTNKINFRPARSTTQHDGASGFRLTGGDRDMQQVSADLWSISPKVRFPVPAKRPSR